MYCSAHQQNRHLQQLCVQRIELHACKQQPQFG
jgi:hypothetical protein